MFLVAYYMVVVRLGLVSFVLNRKRFSLGRFLTYAVMALLWGAYIRFGSSSPSSSPPPWCLNGQEWYHDRFGTEGRLGRGWAALVDRRPGRHDHPDLRLVAKGLTG